MGAFTETSKEEEGGFPSISFPFVGLACPLELRQHEWDIPRFQSIKKLGAGLYSNVYLARCKRTGMEVALKVGRPLTTSRGFSGRLSPGPVACAVEAAEGVQDRLRVRDPFPAARERVRRPPGAPRAGPPSETAPGAHFSVSAPRMRP